jgi:hypothetical protein
MHRYVLTLFLAWMKAKRVTAKKSIWAMAYQRHERVTGGRVSTAINNAGGHQGNMNGGSRQRAK